MTTDNRRLLLHHLLRAAILAGFAVFIVHLSRTGNLALYVESRMVVYVKLSAAGLYATAGYQLYAASRTISGERQADCGCAHEPSSSLFKNTLVYGLFLLPLALGFLLPD